jgi:serine/threonine-protein kinase
MTDVAVRLASALADRYRIERELGAGGMATVYLAQDLKHGRPVALKVLRPELAAVVGAERFIREIATTASLAHPHIVPLYDSGGADDLLYYVMPYIEGESVRDRLTREGPLPVAEAVQIAREVADALAYAHSRGIVHRDIKPENILVHGGHALVADFGIARAVAAVAGSRLTETGLVLGTPGYMSPEQVSGSAQIDGRSDIYALGCVLYEMLAGQPPFTGPTAEIVVHQHLAATPLPVTQLRPAAGTEVQAAVQRALAKTPADRFSGAQQFAEALERSTLGLKSGRGGPPAPYWSRRGVRLAAAWGLAVVLVAAGLLASRRGAAPIQLGSRTQITLDPGLELDPALSADGKLVAYSGLHGALMVRQVEGGGVPVQIVRGADAAGRWPAWLPDGQRLIFVSRRGIESVPALGGQPRLLVAGAAAARGISAAPDGRSFAFVLHDTLFAEPVDGGVARTVTGGVEEMHSPAWSPDGRRIAFVKGDLQYVLPVDLGNIGHSSVWVVSAGGGRPALVSDEQSLNVSPAWAAADRLLYVSDRGGSRDVWQVAVTRSGTRGAPVQLSAGLDPHGIGVSLDGSRLAYSAFTETSNVWSVPIPASGAASVSTARPETQGNQVIENAAVSSDGRWVGFSSVRGNVSQVYRVRTGALASEPQQVTSDSASSYWVAFSPDGKEIAFHRFHGEHRQVFVIPVEGGEPVPVTDGSEDERSPEWAPDGRRLLLLANWGTRGTLRIVTRNADGRWSAARRLPVVLGTDTVAAGIGAWAPDGRSIACGCGEGGLVIVPVDGGQARRLPSAFSTRGWDFPQWSADGRTVYHVSEDSGRVVAVVAVPVLGGPARVVLRFDDPTRPWHRFGFRVGGGRIFVTLGDRQSDIWVADLRRP